MHRMSMSSVRALLLYIFSGLIVISSAFPEQGKWELKYMNVHKDVRKIISKSLFEGTQIFINIGCTPGSTANFDLKVTWALSELNCWDEYLRFGADITDKIPPFVDNLTISPDPTSTKCTDPITVNAFTPNNGAHSTSSESQKKDPPKEEKANTGPKKADGSRKKREETLIKKEVTAVSNTAAISASINHPKKIKDRNGNRVYVISADGIYLLNINVNVDPSTVTPFNLTIEVKMLGPHGYLSAVDWPLLPVGKPLQTYIWGQTLIIVCSFCYVSAIKFYGAMCLTYVILGLAWLIVSFCQWRDLLRIQFWIGGVILLGMLEKATFYAEYQSINSTGQSVQGAVLLAELVSCGKRMLARMLVIIVSLGFGIVKPRLGPMLHRVVFIGILYFILAAVESYLRVMHQKNDSSNQILVASIPLAVLDSAICWWIFTSLVQTTRTLRVRRNVVKLSLYRHFTNTLIFSVVSSVVFMLYSIRYHRLASCLTDWKELWVDDAYWHLLFSVLLLVIMILWRPTNNNQRYAFTPLLDAPEDDEEEDEQFVNDAFGVKMRGYRSTSPKPKSGNTVEDDLKWVEENIPSSMADTALPILDSEEEIMTAKYEASKMQ